MRTSTLHFGGFYESIHNYILEDILDENQDDNRPIFIEYSKNYVKMINDKLGTDFKFDDLDSPKFYNFETDVIIISYSDNDLDVLLNLVNLDDLKNYVDEALKSRPGFVSFYNGFDDIKKDSDKLIEYILKFYFDEVEDIRVDDLLELTEAM